MLVFCLLRLGGKSIAIPSEQKIFRDGIRKPSKSKVNKRKRGCGLGEKTKGRIVDRSGNSNRGY